MSTQDLAIADRVMPWDGLIEKNFVGNIEAAQGLDSKSMLQAAGMDWEVGTRPLWRRMDDGKMVQHSKQREVYRLDNQDELGVCKSRYEVFHNREAFEFGDTLTQEGTGKWVVAGQQNGGARVFMVMELGDTFDVLDGDTYQSYLYVRTSHGDGTSVSASVIPFRLWCTNQNGAAIRSAKSTWSIPHTTTVKDRVEEARQALRLTTNYEAEYKKLAEQLVSVKVSNDKAKALISGLIGPKRARRDDMIADIMSNYQTSESVAPYLGTGYGLLNGLTEYMDHLKPRRNGNAQFQSVMYGEGKSYREDLVQNLLALAS